MPGHYINHEKGHQHPLYNKSRKQETGAVDEKNKTKKVPTSYDAIKNEIKESATRPKTK